MPASSSMLAQVHGVRAAKGDHGVEYCLALWVHQYLVGCYGPKEEAPASPRAFSTRRGSSKAAFPGRSVGIRGR